MKSKAILKITLDLEFDLNQEHPHQLASRIEEEIRNHIAMGMLAGYAPEDADVTNVDINSIVEEL
jgi:hypothetical protein